jgi:hypothetical protein
VAGILWRLGIGSARVLVVTSVLSACWPRPLVPQPLVPQPPGPTLEPQNRIEDCSLTWPILGVASSVGGGSVAALMLYSARGSDAPATKLAGVGLAAIAAVGLIASVEQLVKRARCERVNTPLERRRDCVDLVRLYYEVAASDPTLADAAWSEHPEIAHCLAMTQRGTAAGSTVPEDPTIAALTRAARRFATAGNCALVKTLAWRVHTLAPSYYVSFVTDPGIVRCKIQ